MRRERRKARGLSILVLLMLTLELSIVSSIAFVADADLLTTVTANMDQDEQEVDVSPGSYGSEVCTGIVVVENINTEVPLEVELYANSTVGNATVARKPMVFQGDKQTDTFQVVLNVPKGTSASEVHKGTVSGTWSQGGRSGDVEGDTFKIIILPYSLPDISCDSPHRKITKGESVKFHMKLNNSGNTDDIIRMEIENLKELKEDGIEVSEISDMPIAEGGSKEFRLRVQTSEDTPMINSIRVTATSMVDEELSTDTLILTVHAREKDLIEVIFNPLVFIIITVVIIVGIAVYVKKR